MAAGWLRVAAVGLLWFGCSSSSSSSRDGGTAGSSAVGEADGGAGTGGASGGADAAADADGVGEAADTPPWRELGITVGPAEHIHVTAHGLTAGFDNRSTKMAGKLVLDLGVLDSSLIGGYRTDLGHRGFHVIGVEDMFGCDNVNDWTKGRDFDGNCRLNNLDGLPHGDQTSVTPDQSIMNQVLETLTTLEKTYPAEGWGYFLTRDGTGVRWSDTIFTGTSHCATDAALYAHVLLVSRVVAVAGPRDNTCGKGLATGEYDASAPPWWPLADTCDATHCCLAQIASWIDTSTATPIDRYVGIVGQQDPQWGDILFAMQRMSFVGQPVNVANVAPPYGGSHRLYANVAHGRIDLYPVAVLNIAFDVLPENLNPTF